MIKAEKLQCSHHMVSMSTHCETHSVINPAGHAGKSFSCRAATCCADSPALSPSPLPDLTAGSLSLAAEARRQQPLSLWASAGVKAEHQAKTQFDRLRIRKTENAMTNNTLKWAVWEICTWVIQCNTLHLDKDFTVSIGLKEVNQFSHYSHL